MNKIILKRLAAYLIDIIIVYLLVSLIVSTPIFNKNEKEYTKEMSEYTEIYKEYVNLLSSTNIDQDEINKTLEKLTISNYKLSKLGINSTIFNYSVYIIYFVILLYFAEGQTIGKKLLKLKIVSNNNKKVSIFQLLIRGTILYGFVTSLALILLILFNNQKIYTEYYICITVIESVITTLSMVLILFTKNNLGLHDIISKTHVIELKGNI